MNAAAVIASAVSSDVGHVARDFDVRERPIAPWTDHIPPAFATGRSGSRNRKSSVAMARSHRRTSSLSSSSFSRSNEHSISRPESTSQFPTAVKAMSLAMIVRLGMGETAKRACGIDGPAQRDGQTFAHQLLGRYNFRQLLVAT
jgi:hypothetical protein